MCTPYCCVWCSRVRKYQCNHVQKIRLDCFSNQTFEGTVCLIKCATCSTSSYYWLPCVGRIGIQESESVAKPNFSRQRRQNLVSLGKAYIINMAEITPHNFQTPTKTKFLKLSMHVKWDHLQYGPQPYEFPLFFGINTWIRQPWTMKNYDVKNKEENRDQT